MREFTKSMMSYTWAMSMFGVQQMVNLLTPQGGRQNHPATDAFNNASQCTVDEMGDAMRAAFRLGDNVQRGMVDMTFGVMTLGASNRGGRGGDGQGGGGYGRQGRDYGQRGWNAGQQTANAFQQGMGAMGQAAAAAGQAMSGAAGWGRGDASQSGQTQTGWGPMPSRGTGRGDYGQQASNAGQQTANAFQQGMGAMGQGMAAMGQAADAAGQAVGGAAAGGGRGDRSRSDQAGWDQPPPRGSKG